MTNRLRRGAAALLLLLPFAGCAAGESAGQTASPVPASPTGVNGNARQSPGPKSLPSRSPTPAADVTVAVTIAAGRVTPNAANVRLRRGQSVAVTALSDVAESVHIHGYDKTLTLTPGKPTTVRFIPDQSGVFEIETYETGKLVAKLIVS